ncbi:MAG: DUF2243 domain-containing protein [Chloroflexi bacterium]|nr:DUF2243 domain-containing protein [Chloroflexota bacterium]
MAFASQGSGVRIPSPPPASESASVDHHILGIHHVREGVPNQLAWDLGFLAFGAALVAVGWLLVQAAQRPAALAAIPVEEERRAA